MNRYTLTAIVLVMCASVATARAEIVSETIEYAYDGITFQAYAAWDQSIEGRRPAVLIVHEWWGHDEFVRQQARRVAELGYVGFAIDMYGRGVHTSDPAEAQQLSGRLTENNFAPMRARAQAGYRTMLDHEKVDSERTAAMGYCFGGTVALQLAYAGAPLRGAVSFHGSLPAPQRDDDENIRAKILALHGAEDPLVPEMQIARFKNAMDRAGADWQMIYYGEAVHSFTNPEADEHGIEGVSYDERAARRAWRHMKVFLEECFDTR